MTNITPELFDLMEKVASTNPETPFQLVITTEPNTPVETLQKAGLRVEHEIPIISAVSGTATFEAVKRLANLKEVKQVEYDNRAVRAQ